MRTITETLQDHKGNSLGYKSGAAGSIPDEVIAFFN
jgi:hypothetical protein